MYQEARIPRKAWVVFYQSAPTATLPQGGQAKRKRGSSLTLLILLLLAVCSSHHTHSRNLRAVIHLPLLQHDTVDAGLQEGVDRGDFPFEHAKGFGDLDQQGWRRTRVGGGGGGDRWWYGLSDAIGPGCDQQVEGIGELKWFMEPPPPPPNTPFPTSGWGGDRGRGFGLKVS